MALAQFIQQGMGIAGGVWDSAAQVDDARLQKDIGRRTAAANENRIRRENAYQLGKQRAAMAESGFDSSSGSALMLQGDSAANAELAALTERYKGELQAWESDLKIERSRARSRFVIDPLFQGKKGAANLIFGGGTSYWGRKMEG